MNNPFARFFAVPEPDGSDISDCRQVIEFARCAYYDTFMSYLERGADAKIDTATATSMLTSAERINTFKDIRNHLLRQVRDAQAVIDREVLDE